MPDHWLCESCFADFDRLYQKHFGSAPAELPSAPVIESAADVWQPKPMPADGYSSDGCRQLLAGILRQAVYDTRKGNAEARAWLETTGRAIANELGIRPSAIKKELDAM